MGVANSCSLKRGGVPEAAHLLHAVKKGDHMKALRLLTSMPERAQAISQGAKAAAVHAAIKRGYVNMLQFLRDLPSSNNSYGTTAAAATAASHGPVRLLSSSSHGQAAFLQQTSRLSQQHDSSLTVRGADPAVRQSGLERESWLNAVDRHGRTPLMTAARYNRLEFVEGLVSLGANPWICDRGTRGTVLHLVASLGHAPLVAAILASPVTGPDRRVALYDAQDMYGFTSLHYAAAAGHADVARVLLDAGASYTASSQVLYDPTPGLRRLTSLTHIVGRAGMSFTFSTRGDGGSVGEERSGVLPAPCAPRSNPLHLAAMRGDVAVATLVLQRFLADTDGLTRAARERITDPRTQLNKDGFQPYMLAGNAGHWHVAQLLIPHSRDDRHHLSRSRDRDFLIFFPLPDPATAAASSGEGPPSLTELAARVWAGKLLSDVKLAEAALRQMQQRCGQQSSHTAAPPGSGGGGGGGAPFFRDFTRNGGGGGMFGALLRRSGRFTGLSSADTAGFGAAAAASAASSGNPSYRGQQTLTASSTTISVAAAAAAAAAAATVAVVSPAAAVGNAPATSSCIVAESSPGPSAWSTPRTSMSGCGAGTGIGADVGGGGRAMSTPRRSMFLNPTTPRRTNSLDLIPFSSGPSGTAASATARPSPPSGASLRPNLIPPGWPISQPQSHGSNVITTAPGSPTTSVSTTGPAAAVPPRSPQPSPPLCDVCFERFQELVLRPCPHRMCAACCKRVVEMHCSGAALGLTNAAAARTPGRRSTAVPPRCPFCQATIRGFVPAISVL